jgi:coenzyme F420 biosynthesis associated uncharacterized protein
MDAIDWPTAQRVGELLAGSPPRAALRAEHVQPLAADFAARVGAYSGLRPQAPLPVLEAIDRPAWIAANLRTMRPLMERMAARLDDGARQRRPRGWMLGLPPAVQAGAGLLLGAQVGALTGILSQRVLGQYELSLLEPDPRPRLLLLAPNLEQAAASLELDREELVAWVAIHELTHAVQFGGAPWLREHLAGLLEQLIEGLQPKLSLAALLRPPGGDDVRALAERLRHGELLRVAIGEERWELVERLQATMSLVEGHAEHVMDAVGAELLPSLPRLRAALTRRREHRGLPWRALERLLGLELKLRQYEVGRRFCDAVVAAAGAEGLARVWRGPEALPSAVELEAPQAWLARTARGLPE